MAEIHLNIIDNPANKNENPYILSIVSTKIKSTKGLNIGHKLKLPFTKSGENIM